VYAVTVDNLISAGRLFGSIQGRRGGSSSGGVYIPSVFETARSSYVANFLSQNNYIPYTTLESLQYSNPKAFLEKTYVPTTGPTAGGMCLSSSFVTQSLLDQLEALCTEAITANSYLDLMV
jgi:hypothetical protein